MCVVGMWGMLLALPLVVGMVLLGGGDFGWVFCCGWWEWVYSGSGFWGNGVF